jgi:hypothetical protein
VLFSLQPVEGLNWTGKRASERDRERGRGGGLRRERERVLKREGPYGLIGCASGAGARFLWHR